MRKIVLDPGHGGNDTGAVHFGRQEKDDTLRLALTIGNLLESAGFDVAYTRTSDVYHTPFERADFANKSNGDYFIAIHRNATPIPDSGSGIRFLVFKKDSEAGALAESINGALQHMGMANLGVAERPGLVTLRRTEMPAVWAEVGYIDNQEDNHFFDQHLNEIAASFARGIMEFTDGREEPSQALYRVQVGAFRSGTLARQLLNQLQMQGFPAFLTCEEGFAKVQIGAFTELENAVKMEQALRCFGYNTFITQI